MEICKGKYVMPIMKVGKTNNGRNRTVKSEKHSWREGKLKVLWNIGNGHQRSKDQKRNKSVTRRNEKKSGDEAL